MPPGVLGVATHIPKRSTERRRRNKESAPEVVAAAGVVEVPALPPGMAPMAQAWYESLQESGQAKYYEPSDWTAAQLVAMTMTKFLDDGRPSAVLFAALWQAMGELLTTEGARRRARLEIERLQAPAVKPANVTDYRARLTKGGRR